MCINTNKILFEICYEIDSGFKHVIYKIYEKLSEICITVSLLHSDNKRIISMVVLNITYTFNLKKIFCKKT